MGLIEDIRSKVAAGDYENSLHTNSRRYERDITCEEILQVIASGEVIEDYPNDKYGPSCLILGYTDTGRVLHVQCSYPTRELVKIITVYEPLPSRWVDFRLRKAVE